MGDRRQGGRRLGWVPAALTVVAAASAPLVPFFNKKLSEVHAVGFAVVIAGLAGLDRILQRAESRSDRGGGSTPEAGQGAGAAVATPPPGPAPPVPAPPVPAPPVPAPPVPAPPVPAPPAPPRRRHRWNVGLAFSLALVALFIPLAALPAVLFALRAIRGGRAVAGSLALASAVLLGVVGVVVALGSSGLQVPGPGQGQDPDTAALNQYFSGLQFRCQTGVGPGEAECRRAFDAIGQRQLLEARGWYACRKEGSSLDQCLGRLP